jgi:predicted enzyme related to lactoylglutathione lyase
MMMQDKDYEKLARQLMQLNDQGVTLKMTADEGSVDNIINSVKSIGEAFNFPARLDEMDKAAYAMDNYAASTSRVFGTTREQMRSIKTIAADSFAQVTLMGGGLQDIQKSQEAITKSFHTNVLATKQNIVDLTLLNKTTGVASETLVSGFRSAGFSVSHIKDEMQKTVDYARAVGVNVSEVADKVTKNMGQLNLFNFENGSIGLAKMAAQSSMLGINMETAFTQAEKLLDPQAAIDLSASLQRLGVTSSQLLDPLRVMDLAQNDPAELQNQMVELSKQFVRTKEDGTFEIMPGAKRQLREVAQQLGMNANEFAKMALNSADFDKKMSQMRMPSFDMSEENKTLLANMAQFNKGTNQYEITYTRKDKEGKDETVTKVVSEIPKEDLEAIKKSSEPKTLEDLNKSQLSTQEQMLIQMELFNKTKVIGYGASEMGEEIIKGVLKQQEATFKSFTEKVKESNENIFRKGYDESYNKAMPKGKEITTVTELVTVMKEGLTQLLISTTETSAQVLKDAFSKTGIASIGVDLGVIKQEDLDKFVEAIDLLELAVKGGAEKIDEVIKLAIPEIKKTLAKARTEGGQIATNIFENVDLSFLHDFILTKDGVYKYNEGDIMIGGTNLDGKDNKDIKESIGNISDKKEEKQIVVNVDTPKEENKNILSDLKATFEELNSPLKNDYLNNRIDVATISEMMKNSYDITPLTTVMGDLVDKKYSVYEEQNREIIILLQKMSTSFDTTRKNNDPLTSIKENGNLNRSNLTEKPNVIPTPPTPNLTKLETTTQLPVQKVEFGKLEISLKVDIPNSANVNTDQIKQVLETTMNSTDFKQQLVVAVNQASTNFGQTSAGGTANYGPNKTNYSLSA